MEGRWKTLGLALTTQWYLVPYAHCFVPVISLTMDMNKESKVIEETFVIISTTFTRLVVITFTETTADMFPLGGAISHSRGPRIE
jgi:hypothetical protein